MAVLTLGQLISLAQQAGFQGTAAQTAAAIAMAESGGNTQAYNPQGADNSYGLMQINMKGALGPQRLKQFSISSNEALYDPAANMRAAYSVYKSAGNSFSPWTTYTKGTYKQYLGAAAKAQPEAVGPGGAASAGNPVDPVTEAKTRYGALASYLDNPEIGPILLRGASEGRDAAWLEGQLSQTNWWKTTSKAARDWDLMNRTDPASAKVARDAMSVDVVTAAQNLGFALPPESMVRLTEQALQFGWDAAQIQRAVAAEYRYDPAAAKAGQAGQGVDAARQILGEYALPLSEQTLGFVADKFVKGEWDANALKDGAIRWAKVVYPMLSQQLDQGLTVKQALSPQIQTAAKLLEVSPDTINPGDPKMQQAMIKVGANNQPQLRTLWEMEQEIKTNPAYGWAQTKNAADTIASTVQGLAQRMGVIK